MQYSKGYEAMKFYVVLLAVCVSFFSITALPAQESSEGSGGPSERDKIFYTVATDIQSLDGDGYRNDDSEQQMAAVKERLEGLGAPKGLLELAESVRVSLQKPPDDREKQDKTAWSDFKVAWYDFVIKSGGAAKNYALMGIHAINVVKFFQYKDDGELTDEEAKTSPKAIAEKAGEAADYCLDTDGCPVEVAAEFNNLSDLIEKPESKFEDAFPHLHEIDLRLRAAQ